MRDIDCRSWGDFIDKMRRIGINEESIQTSDDAAKRKFGWTLPKAGVRLLLSLAVVKDEFRKD